MSHIEAAIDGFMNCIKYLREITERFRKFVRIQTKWNDRKTENTFMSSLRAYQIQKNAYYSPYSPKD